MLFTIKTFLDEPPYKQPKVKKRSFDITKMQQQFVNVLKFVMFSTNFLNAYPYLFHVSTFFLVFWEKKHIFC